MPTANANSHDLCVPHRAKTMPVHAPVRREELTEAEMALLAAMAAAPGASSAALAIRLVVAASTVRKRQGAIRAKLGGMEGDLVWLARERGMLPAVTTAAEGPEISCVEGT